MRASLDKENLGSAIIDRMLAEAQEKINELQTQIQSMEHNLLQAENQKNDLQTSVSRPFLLITLFVTYLLV